MRSLFTHGGAGQPNSVRATSVPTPRPRTALPPHLSEQSPLPGQFGPDAVRPPARPPDHPRLALLARLVGEGRRHRGHQGARRLVHDHHRGRAQAQGGQRDDLRAAGVRYEQAAQTVTVKGTTLRGGHRPPGQGPAQHGLRQDLANLRRRRTHAHRVGHELRVLQHVLRPGRRRPDRHRHPRQRRPPVTHHDLRLPPERQHGPVQRVVRRPRALRGNGARRERKGSHRGQLSCATRLGWPATRPMATMPSGNCGPPLCVSDACPASKPTSAAVVRSRPSR